MQFRTTIQQRGKTATGIRVPDDVIGALGAGKRPAVRVTINGYSYRSTVAVMRGAFNGLGLRVPGTGAVTNRQRGH